jgi:probable HAF family extracellular repeat protein
MNMFATKQGGTGRAAVCVGFFSAFMTHSRSIRLAQESCVFAPNEAWWVAPYRSNFQPNTSIADYVNTTLGRNFSHYQRRIGWRLKYWCRSHRLIDPQPNAVPKSINKRTEISGFCGTGGRIHGFFRSKKGQYTLLDFPRANLTEAVGINDDGQVVGDYRDSAGRFHGFFWDAGLFLTFDVPFPEATLTGPNGINNVGQIVGFILTM